MEVFYLMAAKLKESAEMPGTKLVLHQHSGFRVRPVPLVMD
jgi:hypothetical protein